MLRHIPYIIITSSILLHILFTPTPIHNNNKLDSIKPNNVVVFDLGGVLIETNNRAALKELGLINLAWYKISTKKSPSLIKEKLYKVLNLIEPDNNTYNTYDDQGAKLPTLFCDWLAGNRTPEEIRALVLPAIKENKNWFENTIEKKLVYRLARMIFTPERFVKTRKINQDGLAFVKECKDNGHYVCVLSNWDPESFELMKNSYPELFDLFDKIIISGNVNCLKPDKKIYEELINWTDTSNHIVFIDDQKENRDAAQKYGINTIDCPQKNTLMGMSAKPDFEFVRTVFAQLKDNTMIPTNKQKEKSIIS